MVEVFRNPTVAKVKGLTRDGTTLRAAKDYRNGNIYLWGARGALHNEVIAQLGNFGYIDPVGQVCDAASYRLFAGTEIRPSVRSPEIRRAPCAHPKSSSVIPENGI